MIIILTGGMKEKNNQYVHFSLLKYNYPCFPDDLVSSLIEKGYEKIHAKFKSKDTRNSCKKYLSRNISN